MIKKLYLLVGITLFMYSAFAESESTTVNKLVSLAHEQFSLSNWDSAYYYGNESYEEAKRIDYFWGMANSQFVKGWSRHNQNNLSEALLLYLESLRIMQDEMQENDQPMVRASLHMNIGQIYKTYSNFEGALKFYEQGLEIAQEQEDHLTAIKFLYKIGVNYKYSGDLASAAKYFVESKLIALNNNSALWYFNSINQIGLINKDLERYDSARFYFDEAFQVTEKLKNQSKYRAMIFHNKANTYLLEKDFTNAELYFEKSLLEKPRFISYQDLAELYYQSGRYEKSYRTAGLAIDLYDKESVTTEKASIFQTIGSASFALNRNQEGKQFMERYSQEINKYLETREYTKKLEDAYQIDLLTKQYFLKLEQQKRQAQIIQLSWFFGIVVFTFILLFFAQRWYQKRKKADATDAIKAIFNQSEILRGSLDREL